MHATTPLHVKITITATINHTEYCITSKPAKNINAEIPSTSHPINKINDVAPCTHNTLDNLNASIWVSVIISNCAKIGVTIKHNKMDAIPNINDVIIQN